MTSDHVMLSVPKIACFFKTFWEKLPKIWGLKQLLKHSWSYFCEHLYTDDTLIYMCSLFTVQVVQELQNIFPALHIGFSGFKLKLWWFWHFHIYCKSTQKGFHTFFCHFNWIYLWMWFRTNLISSISLISSLLFVVCHLSWSLTFKSDLSALKPQQQAFELPGLQNQKTKFLWNPDLWSLFELQNWV